MLDVRKGKAEKQKGMKYLGTRGAEAPPPREGEISLQRQVGAGPRRALQVSLCRVRGAFHCGGRVGGFQEEVSGSSGVAGLRRETVTGMWEDQM